MCYKYEQIIEDAEIAKRGDGSARMKEVIYENAGDPHNCKYNSLNEEIKIAQERLKIWLPRKQWIDERLAVLGGESDMEYRVIKYRYMMSTKATYEWIAGVIPCSRNWVKPTIEGLLDKMLEVCANAQ